MQIGMFDGTKQFSSDNPVRLIELFGGIGCQSKALENLGIKFEHYKLCEIDKYAVQSYNAIHGTNFVTSDIMKIKASDLEIIDTDKYTYIMTYSFPCTDLSKAGKQMGMVKGSGTRSGLLWEVERLLDECQELPQVLLMENVPDVIGTKNMPNFAEWIAKLEKLGYKNYWKVLNATEFGIPQNRERCFMISLLGDYYYEFPKETKLELRLRDMLENEVDEKYYLSDKALQGKINSKFGSNNLSSILPKDGIIPTLMARDYKDPKLVQVTQLDGFESSGRVYSENGLAPTINTMGGGNREPKIAEINEIYGWNYKDSVKFSSPPMKGLSKTLRASNDGACVIENLRIRKLTPKECWRLMGLSDTDFDKAKASGVSNSQLYKQAGNGIVVNVLMEIFNKLNLKKGKI